MLDGARNVSETTKKEKKYDQNGQTIHRKRIRTSYAMYQKAQDNFIDPGLLSSLKRKIISEEPGAVDGRQL